MNFYEITDFDNQTCYESTLKEAHRTAKCKRPYSCVSIELVSIDTSKAGVQGMLDALFKRDKPLPQAMRTGIRWTLSPRGGLRPLQKWNSVNASGSREDAGVSA